MPDAGVIHAFYRNLWNQSGLGTVITPITTMVATTVVYDWLAQPPSLHEPGTWLRLRDGVSAA